MPRERIVLIGLAVLLIGALLFAGAAAGQRGAWMEGYMMGRLSMAPAATAAGTASAVAPYGPYAPYAVGYAHRGPGFGGVLFLLLGFGLVAFVVSRFACRARWHHWMAMQGAPGDWRQGPPPPWMQGGWSHGSATGQAGSQPEPGQTAGPSTPAAGGKPSSQVSEVER